MRMVLRMKLRNFRPRCGKFWGSNGPAPSSSASLETALRQSRNAVVSLLVNCAFVFGFLFWIGVLSLVMQHLLAVLSVTQGRLRAGPNLLGSQCFVWHLCVVIAPLGAVTMVGGSSDPSVPWSPGVTFQEKAGRPMGPSTLRCEFPWEVVVVYVGLVFWFFRFLSVLCDAVVISQGSVFLSLFL